MNDIAHKLLALATGHRPWHSIFILPLIAMIVWVVASAAIGVYGRKRISS